jgi:hypothetical protein
MTKPTQLSLAMAALTALLGACSKTNPYYCEDNPDHNCALDAAVGADGPMTCTEASDCDEARPVCDEANGACVACKGSDLGSCGGTTPACSATNECRACAANADCASNACMPDGSCADAANVLYASSTGGATTCTLVDRCSLDQAVTLADANRKIIVLDTGTYTTNGALVIAKALTVLGRGTQIVRGGAGTGPVITVTSGGNLGLYYAKVTQGSDPSTGSGITCVSGTLLVRGVTTYTNAANGINTLNCNVTIDRSTIYDNDAGGIFVKGGSTNPFTITNNFIYLNGDDASSYFGGVKIEIPTPDSSRLEFNTIVDNEAFTGAGNSGGVVCTNFTTANNIVARNSVGATTDGNTQIITGCNQVSSKIQAALDDLAFGQTTQPYDLRIGSASVAKDAATTASDVVVDFDGDVRPQHGAKDIGADEYK